MGSRGRPKGSKGVKGWPTGSQGVNNDSTGRFDWSSDDLEGICLFISDQIFLADYTN